MNEDKLNKATLYFDSGKGYNESDTLQCYFLLHKSNKKLNIKFNLEVIPNEAFSKPFRFDPIENTLCKLSHWKITCDNQEKIITYNPKLAKTKDNEYLILSDDPQLYIGPLTKGELRISYTLTKLKKIPALKKEMRYNSKFIIKLYNKIDKLTLSKSINKLNNNLLKTNNKDLEKKIIVIFHEGTVGGASLLALGVIKAIKEYTSFNPVSIFLKGGILCEKSRKYGETYVVSNTNTKNFDDNDLMMSILNYYKKGGAKYSILNSASCGNIIQKLKKSNFKVLTLMNEMTIFSKFLGIEDNLKKTTEYSDLLVFPSKVVKKDIMTINNKIHSKSHILPQGIYLKSKLQSIKSKERSKDKLSKTIGFKKNNFVVLGSGNETTIKGFDLFLNTAISLLKKRNDISFIWLGKKLSNGKENLSYIYAKYDLEKLGLYHNFYICDYVEDPSIYFEGSDLFYLSSRTDSFPSVVLESLNNYTVPIVFDDAGGAIDAVSFCKDLIIPYRNTKKAAQIINKFADNNKSLLKIAKIGKKSCINYNMDIYVKNLLKLLQKQI